MPRQARLIVPGLAHHIVRRGHNRGKKWDRISQKQAGAQILGSIYKLYSLFNIHRFYLKQEELKMERSHLFFIFAMNLLVTGCMTSIKDEYPELKAARGTDDKGWSVKGSTATDEEKLDKTKTALEAEAHHSQKVELESDLYTKLKQNKDNLKNTEIQESNSTGSDSKKN